MLRSPKSTQRKMRQLELVLDEGSASINGDISAKLSGPAKKQVKSITCDSSTKIVEMELNQPFAAKPLVIRNNADSIAPGDRKGGSGADQIRFTIDNAGLETHILIVGSDITEQY
ncbi:MAG: hypothetical protein CMG00_06155 [Candidatus Marinimicrobia bacterium]|nr:hypothetical protein [Candidatus Neomarinimicrobiota bacterium]|tara:strand:+ start:4757 stop:5101 length:345 start_codon:yes stop_codon:yes gene_type:complete